VALIGGGHAVGKGHGACRKGAGVAPNVAYNATPLQAPWQGLCGTGKGADTVTAGFEGAWTTNPLAWDNEYYKALLENQWEKHVGPGGHWQWRIAGSDDKRMRLTSDIALLHDAKYLEYVKQFAGSMEAFNVAFEEAWFDLTTTYGSGTWAKNAKCDNGAFPESIRFASKKSSYMMNTDLVVEKVVKSTKGFEFVGVFAVAGAIASMFIVASRKRSNDDIHEPLINPYITVA